MIATRERQWLINSAGRLNRWVGETEINNGPKQHTQEHGLRPGDDFNRRGPSWSDILGPHGWGETSPGRWRRPGKERGWSATAGYCQRKDGLELLAVVSSH